MEPITTGVMIILGKYALDKGTELGKEVGPVALDKVKEMFGMALDKLRKDPVGKVYAEQYEKDPKTLAEPVKKELDKAIEIDATFAEALKKLLSDYDAEAKKYADTHGKTYNAIAGENSTIVQGNHNVTASGGGIAVGGNVEGGIHTGGNQGN